MSAVFFVCEDWTDSENRPAGGVVTGCGLQISWQNGPLGRGADRRKPNGAFVEDVIAAAIHRLRFYQSTPFHCQENWDAIELLSEAVKRLNARTARRERAGIEGTHKEDCTCET